VYTEKTVEGLAVRPDGELLGVFGYAACAAARLFLQLGRQGSFNGGLSFCGGGLRGGNLSRLGGSVRAGRQDFRAIDRAGLLHSEPLVCEPALAQAPPGFDLLSERHGEGAAAQGLELSSQALGLL
jgi:hypothetical protein